MKKGMPDKTAGDGRKKHYKKKRHVEKKISQKQRRKNMRNQGLVRAKTIVKVG